MKVLLKIFAGLMFSVLVTKSLVAQQILSPATPTYTPGTDVNASDHTPETYNGKLTCTGLQPLMANFNSFVSSFCEYAIRDCEATKYFKDLDPKDPLWDLLYDQLRNEAKYHLEICELAIKHHAPEYYTNNLKR